MIKGFSKYYAATRDGVRLVEARTPITQRGVVFAWQCKLLDREPKHGMYTMKISHKYLFTDEEQARKAVFRLKLTTEE